MEVFFLSENAAYVSLSAGWVLAAVGATTGIMSISDFKGSNDRYKRAIMYYNDIPENIKDIGKSDTYINLNVSKYGIGLAYNFY